jgi:galactose mutarotase-like enzyme
MSDWYQIENSALSVQVNSQGAELKRVFAKYWRRELLWNPNDEKSKAIWNRSAPILFPIVGKLKEGAYYLKEKTYQMPQHGFARDQTFKCLECSTAEIEFVLEATQETFKLYPYCFELRVKYSLEGTKLLISHIVKNVDRQDIYFSIGAHPAFDTAKLENYEIHFEKAEKSFVHLNNGLVDWKKPIQLEGKILKPTTELFSKDALIFSDVKSEYIDLVDTKRLQTIRINGTATPFLGIWGKDAIPFVCIEPWFGVSDDEGHDQNLENKRGIHVLGMGKSFEFAFSIELLTGSN